MKVIEIKYKGVKFRSRLEARWALYFDLIGIKWEYEVEGFLLSDGSCYLPDFYLPKIKKFVEVKPFNQIDKRWWLFVNDDSLHKEIGHGTNLLALCGGSINPKSYKEYNSSYNNEAIDFMFCVGKYHPFYWCGGESEWEQFISEDVLEYIEIANSYRFEDDYKFQIRKDFLSDLQEKNKVI